MVSGKYKARAVEVNGYRFASQAEAQRYCELLELQRAGAIHDLHVHKRFPLHASGGQKIGYYECDFYYVTAQGEQVVEDVKSPVTARLSTYRLKRRLFEAEYGLTISEIYSKRR